MSLVLGVDTGGTYTDAIILDEANKLVLAKAKALTTHHQLELGITEAIQKVIAGSSLKPQQLSLVSVSTTLATNAAVEGVNPRIAAILIGMQNARGIREKLEKHLKTDDLVHLRGGHDSQGNPIAPLDLESLASYLEGPLSVSAFAVCSFFSVRNPEHERACLTLIKQKTGLAVSTSHELATDLDAPKRALTTILNARLIGLISHFIKAVKASLAALEITAPLMMVKGDGSLITAEEASFRPVETLYSGPAASLVGASYLSQTENAVIADIGGTTTDIAILQGGQPKLNPKGVQIGQWQTLVKAVDMKTFGLGGDSEVRLESSGLEPKLFLGPRRVLPLSLLALEHKDILRVSLEQQINEPLRSEDDGYFVLAKPDVASEHFPEKELLGILDDKPVPLRKLIKHRRDRILVQKLIRQQRLMLAGLTPSDAAHVLGLHTAWDTEIAYLGANLFAQKRDKRGLVIAPNAKELSKQVYEQVIRQSQNLILDTLLESDGYRSRANHELIQAGLAERQNRLTLSLQLSYPLLALGASAKVYYPDVGKTLRANTIIPDHADVASAVGAVVGLVRAEAQMQLSGLQKDLIRVHHPEGNRDFNDLNQALEFAKKEVLDHAKSKAQKAGARDLEYSLEIRQTKPQIGEEQLFIEAVLTAKAFGRPRFALEEI